MSGRNEQFLQERVFVGLGGNIGDPEIAMSAALKAFAASPDIDIVGVSSLYRTPPWGNLDQPDFLNAVAELRCKLSPHDLMNLCLEIEQNLKRSRGEKWGPRTIDLDIVAFGERTIDEPGLTVPHPRLHERAFVLMPMAEIAPDFEIGGLRVRDLQRAVDTDGLDIESRGESWAGLGCLGSD